MGLLSNCLMFYKLCKIDLSWLLPSQDLDTPSRSTSRCPYTPTLTIDHTIPQTGVLTSQGKECEHSLLSGFVTVDRIGFPCCDGL